MERVRSIFMPFKAFDIEALKTQFPASTRLVSKPSVAVMDNGRIQFSTMVSAALVGCKVISVGFEEETNKLAITGYPEAPKGKESKVLELILPKANKKGQVGKSIAFSASMILKGVKYDYKKAGNQTFPVEKFDEGKHMIIFALPTTTPAMRPKTDRKKKAPKVTPPAATTVTTNSGANGAAVAPPVKGDEDIQVDL